MVLNLQSEHRIQLRMMAIKFPLVANTESEIQTAAIQPIDDLGRAPINHGYNGLTQRNKSGGLETELVDDCLEPIIDHSGLFVPGDVGTFNVPMYGTG
jgi:hypothetical protein